MPKSGNTPLIRLTRLVEPGSAGKRGQLKPGDRVVEFNAVMAVSDEDAIAAARLYK